MDVTQDGLVIGRTFLPTITPICSSRSGVQGRSVGVRTGDGEMVRGGYPDICGLGNGSYCNDAYGGGQ